MAKTHSVHAAKTHLSRLIEKATAGEEVIITRGKKPVVRLVPANQAAPKRRFGAMRGRARIDATFFEPLPAEELAVWDK